MKYLKKVIDFLPELFLAPLLGLGFLVLWPIILPLSVWKRLSVESQLAAVLPLSVLFLASERFDLLFLLWGFVAILEYSDHIKTWIKTPDWQGLFSLALFLGLFYWMFFQFLFQQCFYRLQYPQCFFQLMWFVHMFQVYFQFAIRVALEN